MGPLQYFLLQILNNSSIENAQAVKLKVLSLEPLTWERCRDADLLEIFRVKKNRWILPHLRKRLFKSLDLDPALNDQFITRSRTSAWPSLHACVSTIVSCIPRHGASNSTSNRTATNESNRDWTTCTSYSNTANLRVLQKLLLQLSQSIQPTDSDHSIITRRC